jgi:hypothetical protein
LALLFSARPSKIKKTTPSACTFSGRTQENISTKSVYASKLPGHRCMSAISK